MNLSEKFIQRQPDSKIEHTEKHKEILNKAHNLIKQRLKDLKINIKHEFSNQRIHYLENEEKEGGAYTANKDVVKLSTEDTTTTVHELLHAYSSEYRQNNFKVVEKEAEENKKSVKSGFMRHYYRDWFGEDKMTTSFEQINEAITDKLTHELLETNPGPENSYFDYIKILDLLIEGVAIKYSEKNDDLSETKKQIWIDLQKSYFNGEVMILRIFDKVYEDSILRKFNEINIRSKEGKEQIQELYKELELKNQKMLANL